MSGDGNDVVSGDDDVVSPWLQVLLGQPQVMSEGLEMMTPCEMSGDGDVLSRA